MFLRIIQLSFLLLFTSGSIAQELSYLDSLRHSISNLSKKKQIEKIVTVSFDKVLADVDAYNILADQAIQFSNEIQDSFLLAKSLEKKGLVLHFSSRTDEAIQNYLEVVKIYENLNLYSNAGEVFTDLAWNIKYLDIKRSFEYMYRGLKLQENNKGDYYYASIDNLGALHGINKNWDSALYYHKKALKYRKKQNDSVGIPFGYSHLANVYLKTKQFAIAKKYLDSSLQIREKRNDIYGITDNHLYMGDLHFEKGEFSKAINNYLKGYELSTKNKYYPLKKYAAEYIYKSYNALNNYEEALKYHLVYTQLKDSILNVETNNRINQLEIEFQTEKKEKEILTQRADLAEKNLTIQERNYQLFGLLGVLIILGLLSYLIYNQQKIKNNQLKKENELKEVMLKIENQNKLQEQRLRISRDLHDNIGAQLTFIISSLDNLKYGFELPKKLNNKLKKISEFTSVTITDLRDTIWAMNKEEISFEDLRVRISNFVEKANLATHNLTFKFSINDNVNTSKLFTSIEGMNIYRIIQEAINNTIKYAEADAIEVSITENKSKLQIEIKDNGLGFDQKNVELGNGINNMRKRARDIGANLDIKSGYNSGTSITININDKNIR